MNSTTVLARIFGPVSLTLGADVVVRGPALWSVAREIVNDPQATLIIGVIYLMVGLTVITFHNKWKGVTEIIVTLIGWMMLLRGLINIFAPDVAAHATTALFDSSLTAPPFIAAVFGIGAWLSYVGYVDKRHEKPS